jgi:hypothetical protein
MSCLYERRMVAVERRGPDVHAIVQWAQREYAHRWWDCLILTQFVVKVGPFSALLSCAAPESIRNPPIRASLITVSTTAWKKNSMSTRPCYSGLRRKLVLGIDVGTTFSGVSYCILDPGVVPIIHGINRYVDCMFQLIVLNIVLQLPSSRKSWR